MKNFITFIFIILFGVATFGYIGWECSRVRDPTIVTCKVNSKSLYQYIHIVCDGGNFPVDNQTYEKVQVGKVYVISYHIAGLLDQRWVDKVSLKENN